MNKVYTYLILLSLCISNSVYSQNKGTLTGSFESNNQIYKNDSKIGARAPKDKFGSNNYLKLDYTYGNFRAGIQYEAYLPPLLGYDFNLEDNGIVHRFVSYENKGLAITVGNFYEQFGSGLLFRAWEDRQLGLNNALEGVNIKFKPTDYISLKAVYGKQRKYFDTGDGRIRGIDGEINVLDALKASSNSTFLLGVGYLNRYQDYTGPIEDYPSSVDAWSARMDFSTGRSAFQFEYVRKGEDGNASTPQIVSEGEALLANYSYTQKGLGFNFSFRRLENMIFRSEREAVNNELLVNYLPANTKQHKYSLANIYPYSTQAMGEIGGQIDFVYTFKKKTALGGKYGTNVALNYSHYNKLEGTLVDGIFYSDSDFLGLDGSKLYRDFNVEISKKWSKKLKSTFAFINLEYNKSELEGGNKGMVKSKIYVADILYKLKKGKALRTELQYLNTDQDMGDWIAGALEYNIGSKWSFFVSDMYNSGVSDTHYINVGGSYVKNATRFSVSYGRQKEGLLCVGGVCRMVPAASGLTISLSKSF
ncbi:DUF6029 family protein [Marinifilum flexuosum]|uniref:DUF6029 family protein n=1 Tax=Marinifilum flexuosum TaxID=1117708 RepID=UPI002490CD6F|nr:DUF6029 family protein [Marinifilum flexuosum]